jgi:polyisoprenoid-binding protein YceI
MLAQLTVGLALAAGSCAPAIVQRAQAPDAPYTITNDCAAHTVTFTIHTDPDHLYFLTYGSAPPLGARTDTDGNLSTTQTTHDIGPTRTDIYDPATGQFLDVEEFNCSPSCG